LEATAMKSNTQRIIDEVTSLSPTERAEIVERIIESFDTEPDEELKKIWADEAKRRLDSYYKGGAQTVSEDEVFLKIEKTGS
jgi:putative addiction module component (TIGR02574 family)